MHAAKQSREAGVQMQPPWAGEFGPFEVCLHVSALWGCLGGELCGCVVVWLCGCVVVWLCDSAVGVSTWCGLVIQALNWTTLRRLHCASRSVCAPLAPVFCRKRLDGSCTPSFRRSLVTAPVRVRVIGCCPVYSLSWRLAHATSAPPTPTVQQTSSTPRRVRTWRVRLHR